MYTFLRESTCYIEYTITSCNRPKIKALKSLGSEVQSLGLSSWISLNFSFPNPNLICLVKVQILWSGKPPIILGCPNKIFKFLKV